MHPDIIKIPSTLSQDNIKAIRMGAEAFPKLPIPVDTEIAAPLLSLFARAFTIDFCTVLRIPSLIP